MSTIAKTEAHAGSGDLGEGYKAPQNPAEPYQQGKENSHNLLDGKDERSHANSVAAASRLDKEGKDEAKSAYEGAHVAAQSNNEPSRGAKVDAELEAEDEAILAKKDGKTDSLPGKH
ncbi:uncharacterized protein JCM10292_002697 [Rhodotorula paludigena]|uniref:uncharacterized protein n=1 Tax=Rhodotorula paludigena TaxID=86838 RepID=UPI0031711420